MDGNVTGKVNEGLSKEGPKTEPQSAEDLVLQEALDNYPIAMEAWSENRKNYLEDLTMALSANLWDEETKRLRGKNRPALSANKLNAITKQVIGDYRKNEIGIKVRPVDSKADVKKAKLRDGLLRNIQDVSNAQDAYITGLECAVRGGFGFFKLTTDYANNDDFDVDLRYKRITNPLSILIDPFYTEVTGTDMGWCFETEIVPRKEFQKKHPKAQPQSWDVVESKQPDWYTEKGVRIANYWRIEYETKTIALLEDGSQVVIESDEQRAQLVIVKERTVERKKVRCYRLCGHQVIESFDFPGQYIPIVIVPGEEADIEGKRILRSAIYYSKDAQRMSDYWKTAATETVALQPKAPWKGTAKHIEGYKQYWETANSGNWQFLPYNPDDKAPGGPSREQPPAFSAAEMQMALSSSDDIKATSGVYDASLGARSNETSGKAILARQREGDNATFIFIDNIARAIKTGGMIANQIVPEIMDTEREVRILGIDGEPEVVTINQMVQDLVTLEWVKLNDITEGKYDVTVTTGPAFATQRAEAAESMMEFIRVYPQAAPLIGDLLAKNMDWPGSDEISDRLKRAMPPEITTDPESPEGKQAQAEAQAKQEQAQQLAMQIADKEATAKLAEADAKIAKAEADKVKAQAEVIKATTPDVETTVSVERPAGQPSAPQSPAAPPVAIQISADQAIGEVALMLQGMAAQTTANTEALTRVAELIGNTLASNQQLDAEQAALLREIVTGNAQAHGGIAVAIEKLAQGIDRQNAIALAPTKPVYDRPPEQGGRIIGAMKQLQA